MDIAVARKRINEVLKVDSINNSDSDFIATHVPFRNIIVNTNNHGQNVEINSSEEEIFYDIFENESVKDKHQLIIVEGLPPLRRENTPVQAWTPAGRICTAAARAPSRSAPAWLPRCSPTAVVLRRSTCCAPGAGRARLKRLLR